MNMLASQAAFESIRHGEHGNFKKYPEFLIFTGDIIQLPASRKIKTKRDKRKTAEQYIAIFHDTRTSCDFGITSSEIMRRIAHYENIDKNTDALRAGLREINRHIHHKIYRPKI